MEGRRGPNGKSKRVQFHLQIPIGCFNEVYREIETTIYSFCAANDELYKPLMMKKKNPDALLKRDTKTCIRKATIKEGQKSIDYHRYIPESRYDGLRIRVKDIIERYKKEMDCEPEMEKKIKGDGWSVKRSGSTYFASKSADEIVQGNTICDLFEAIYGSREFNEDLKPIKKYEK